MKAQLIQGGRQYLGVSVYNQFSVSKPTIPSATVVHTTGQTHIGALAGFGAVVGAVVRGCFLTPGGCSPSAGGARAKSPQCRVMVGWALGLAVV